LPRRCELSYTTSLIRNLLGVLFMDANQAWIAVFRRIPGNLHDGLTIGLRSGVEIAIQAILKLEPDFIIMRGRLTGTQEGGKILMMPYAEMTVLSITRAMKDEEVEAIFGKGDPPALIDLPPAIVAIAPSEPGTPAEAVSDAAASSSRPEPPTKTAMLAKLRERLKEAPKRK
jgi:hypothetical protein